MQNFNSIEDVKKHLENLSSLAALNPEDYAPEEGIADRIATESEKEMKFTQIRKFFAHIKKIEATLSGNTAEGIDRTKLYLLMPELAYGVGREVISKKFYDIMKVCLSGDKIKTVADFKRFVELLTAVVAYSKFSKFKDKKGGSK
jgi:CRISPR-associated protein Csm2